MKVEYYNKDTLETTIYVDVKEHRISIENHTDDILCLAFGVKQNPTWEDFEALLESRCFPKERANVSFLLKGLGVSHYDPLQICMKTEGYMAEDYDHMKFIMD